MGESNTTWTGAAQYGISNATNVNSTSTYGNVAGESLSSDWGNAICTGWRTLTNTEWAYVLNGRTASTVGGTNNGRYAKATVNSVSGLILFPDSYTHPDGVTAPASVNTYGAAYTANNYDATDWSKMETAGAVFLPAAGSRTGTVNYNTGSDGVYWSSSSSTSNVNRAYYMFFTTNNLKANDDTSRNQGLSVRLVYNAN